MLASDLLDRSCALYGSRTAVRVVGGSTISYAQLRARALGFSSALARMGVRPQDRVLLLAKNGLAYFDVYLACAYSGAIAAPVNPALASNELQQLIDIAESRVIVVEESHVHALRDVETRSAHVVVHGTKEFEERILSDAGSAIPYREANPDEIVIIFFTSGTTSQPKGVCLSHRSLVINALVLALAQGITSQDVFLSMTPLYHAAAGTRVFSMLLDGQTHVVLPEFDVRAALSAIERYRVTTTIAVPTQLKRLLESPLLKDADLSSLRLLVYGAGPSSASLIREAAMSLPCGLYHGYGLSEAATIVTGLTADDHVRYAGHNRFASIGRPVTGVALSIRDPSGETITRDDRGEIWVRSDKLMLGYWRNPDATLEVLRDGWLRTGDVGYQDEDGYVFLTGRLKDMIVSGGVNVSPAEIESVLEEFPLISEAAVVGQPDPEWGEVPVAFIVVRGEVSPQELTRFCKRKMSRYKTPREYVVIDAIPKDPAGKVRKEDLRARLGLR